VKLRAVAFVEAFHVGSKQRPTTILVKPSFTTGDKGAANAIAQAWHNPHNKVDSCHYVVDEAQTIQCVPDNRMSHPYGVGAYQKALTVNMCYDPPKVPTDLVMFHTANLVAHLCKKYKIKCRILDEEQIDEWGKRKWKSKGGIDLLDCWPMKESEFDVLVRAAYKNL
jgi:hypothetical protein